MAAEDRLNPKELEILEKYRENLSRDRIALSRALEMFQLFLNGYNCEEIARLNPGFTYEMVLEARVNFGWDDKKDQYLAELYGGIKEKFSKVQVESVSFISDILSVAHKQFGDRFKKYLQTGNVKDLGEEFTLNGLKDYSKVAELLLKMTGQGEGSKAGAGGGTKIQIVGKDIQVNNGKELPKESGYAKQLLELLEKNEEDK